MSRKQIAQKVRDFEYNCLKESIQTAPYPYNLENENKNQRYSRWNLNQIIKQLKIKSECCEVYWVGYGQQCLLQAFIFCLLSGSKNRSQEKLENNFIRTKYNIYQLAEKYLTAKQQTSLVQNLCYTQYTQNIGDFLNKTQAIQLQIKKIFKNCIQPLKQPLSPIQQIKIFSLNFNFVKFEIKKQNVALLTISNQQYYIIHEKQCVFIVTVNQMLKNIDLSNIRLNTISGRVSNQTCGDEPSKQMQTYMIKSQSINNSNDFYNISNQSSNSKKLEYSTPKFLPHKNGTIKDSSKTKQIRTQNIQINKFDQKQRQQLYQKIDFSKNLSPIHQINKDKSKKFKPIFNFNKKNKQQKKTNLSLRNTIDIHIGNLQNLDRRHRQKKRNISEAFSKNKSLSRSKQKSQDKTKQNIDKYQIDYALKSQNRFESSLPTLANQTNCFDNPLHQIMSSQSILSNNNLKYANTQLVRMDKFYSMTQRNIIYYPRVAFAYFSP